MEEVDKQNMIKRTFDMLDIDKDGNIDVEELERFISNQGMNIPQEELQLLVEKIDTNQDGKIQFSEFEQIMEKMMDSEAEDNILKQIFGALDRKNDNVITPDELKYSFYCLGEILTDDEVRHLIQFASKGKESVDYEDFKKMCKDNK